MKSRIFILCLLALFTLHSSDRQRDFPKLTGPYLGQKPPGMTPEILAPGILSTGLEECLSTIMPGGQEIIYTVIYNKPHNRHLFSVLIRIRTIGGIWSPPEVMDFSRDKYAYLYPFISYDGKELFFQSDRPPRRPELKDTYNIWRCRRIGNGWDAPEPLPFPINGKGDVSGPSISLVGDFYFTLMSGKPEIDGIYRSRYRDGKFSEPERLPKSVNVKQGSFDGVISPDGSYYLVNVYGKEDSFGETDLYVSFKINENEWTPLRNLGKAINTRLNEGSARITSDGKYIFFSGYLVSHNFYNDSITYADILYNRLKPQYGNSDIYWVSAKIIEELKPKELK